MKIGILGAGSIAHKMAETVRRMEKTEIYAVASRSLEKAEDFAKQYHIPKAYGNYEDMVKDSSVDLVYVATPHSHHYEHVKLCLENGRNVLCEKAFMINSAQAKEVVRIAREKKLLLAEAIWTRYMPSRELIREAVDSGIIGRVTSLTANLGYAIGNKERLVRSDLGGGALLDLGVYPINFALMVFGEDYQEVSAQGILSDQGVDLQNSITLTWKNGRMALLHSNMEALTDRRGIIHGDKGYLVVENINNCEAISAYDLDRKLIKQYEIPEQITGFEYEVESCRRALENGETECKEMPLSDSIAVMEMMDRIRKLLGIRYTCE
ncbi:Gfo/Idh/MocA family oxidoreductase [Lachnospiraceae bacterium WCA-9-b2]|uniref:Gfo/Idh/MocA family oxidoreductase n=1 Tax=Sporofaciens musculi TaxID=2681861 RepID=A0A7X3MK99_9FIRM|nr:Gfo/Idh/MocA family oxidoreductase [Sporofaciens musculi]MXP77917.1 Gfo/Idh/MocA family oxidoreductase [Sporofaciens musculi]